MNYFDVNKLKEELNTFDKLLEKMAFTPTSAPPPPMTQMPPQGGQPPMDPAMAQGGAPAPGGMDPQFEGALAELAQGTQKLGEEVGAQRDQIDQLTQRLLQME